MHPFEETMSAVGAFVIAIVAGIIVLTLFFRALSWITGKKAETLSVKGVLGKTTVVTVYMASGESFERVHFIGFTASQGMKTHLPWGLDGMVILEDEQHQRWLVRAKNIKMIVIPPETAP
jgi:hypothetical protein